MTLVDDFNKKVGFSFLKKKSSDSFATFKFFKSQKNVNKLTFYIYINKVCTNQRGSKHMSKNLCHGNKKWTPFQKPTIWYFKTYIKRK
jgi:hypothetical protein